MALILKVDVDHLKYTRNKIYNYVFQKIELDRGYLLFRLFFLNISKENILFYQVRIEPNTQLPHDDLDIDSSLSKPRYLIE